MLTLTHLRFTCQSTTPIELPGYRAGGQLRGALGNIMRRAYCPEARFGNGRATTPEHAALCPVCWLLAANEHPGEERRGYSMVAPPVNYRPFATGERFDFGLTLFGDTLRLMPYFLLAVAEMGREGVGVGRGRFDLRQVMSVDPLIGKTERVLAEGESLVHPPSKCIDAGSVTVAASQLATGIGSTGRLSLRFLTPMRLIANEQLIKVPDFGVLFARLLERIDHLDRQFCGGARRDEAERQTLQAHADHVRLADSRVEWVEVRSGSARSGEPTWISGFVGESTYIAPEHIWLPLLPWLVWGTLTQVGKDVVKGNGVFRIVQV